MLLREVLRVGDLYSTKCYMSLHPKSKFKTTFIITQRYGVWLSSLLTLFHGFPNPLDAEIDFFEVKGGHCLVLHNYGSVCQILHGLILIITIIKEKYLTIVILLVLYDL